MKTPDEINKLDWRIESKEGRIQEIGHEIDELKREERKLESELVTLRKERYEDGGAS